MMTKIDETGQFSLSRLAWSLFNALLAAFGKNEKANISAEEKHLLSKLVKELVAFWRKRNESSIH